MRTALDKPENYFKRPKK